LASQKPMPALAKTRAMESKSRTASPPHANPGDAASAVPAGNDPAMAEAQIQQSRMRRLDPRPLPTPVGLGTLAFSGRLGKFG
jgi:hypothetical protein